ncbi:MAG TPA: transporter [Planctomycetota bacterium]|nr:transporter [Planctomycetota bacterium]
MTALLLAVLVQEGALDVLDGETLYEDGWLFTMGYERVEKRTLREGTRRRSDPLDRRQVDQAVVASAHYGLRHDLQLSLIVPWVRRELSLDGDDAAADGPGDVTAAAKYRYLRLDGPGWATNFAVLGGLELPTGSDDERDGGARLPADLQPGSGSWDPFLGTGLTHEPGRWRFNAFAFYRLNGQGGFSFAASSSSRDWARRRTSASWLSRAFFSAGSAALPSLRSSSVAFSRST